MALMALIMCGGTIWEKWDIWGIWEKGQTAPNDRIASDARFGKIRKTASAHGARSGGGGGVDGISAHPDGAACAHDLGGASMWGAVTTHPIILHPFDAKLMRVDAAMRAGSDGDDHRDGDGDGDGDGSKAEYCSCFNKNISDEPIEIRKSLATSVPLLEWVGVLERLRNGADGHKHREPIPRRSQGVRRVLN
ncbi:hypothetical protein B0H17DRAFT_1142153 [Mycena rosella]|uniref:Uncharacterized protein n=1 Tax=Mycena rosella TaxID=1033263 RepID=A0AAD7CZ89_MYCRO|nr:hypothetical protein B0H17DRAFT_1142153 [Mycena rosella]